MTIENRRPSAEDRFQDESTGFGEQDKPPEELLLDADSDVRPVLSVVMPTLDEEDGIVECITQIKAAVTELGVPAEVIVVDSSTDRTPEFARQEGAIVVEPAGKGYGNAYKTGFDIARGRYIAMGDADTTYDFASIPALLAPVANGDADICMGSRLDGEIEPGAMPPLHRFVGNPLLTRFLNVFYGAGVSDAHSGFRVLSRQALETLHLDSDGMEFASEMVMDASARGLRIEEVPIRYHEREGEETLDSFSDGWRHVRFMLLNAPSYLFSVPGLVMFGAGLVLIVLSLFGVVGGQEFGFTTAVAGSLLIIVGFQVASFGVFSAVAADPIREPQDPVSAWIRESFSLEHGVAGGSILAGVGILLLAQQRFDGGAANASSQESLTLLVLASTVILVGVMVIFASFFISLIASET